MNTVMTDQRRTFREAPDARGDTLRAAVFFGLVLGGAFAVVLVFVALWFMVGNDMIMLAGLGLATVMVITGLVRMDSILNMWSRAHVAELHADAADQRADNEASRLVAVQDAHARRADAQARLEAARVTAYTRTLRLNGAPAAGAAANPQLPPVQDADGLVIPRIAQAAAVTREILGGVIPPDPPTHLTLPNGALLSINTLRTLSALWPTSRREARAAGAAFTNQEFTVISAIFRGAETVGDVRMRQHLAMTGQWSALPDVQNLCAGSPENPPTDRPGPADQLRTSLRTGAPDQ